MPSKPSKCSIKIQALVDTKTFYTLNSEMYPGPQPPGLHSCINKLYDFVKRLTAPISKRNPNVTFHNWLTSYPLMLYLLKEPQLTSAGAIRRTKLRFLKKCCKLTIQKRTIFEFEKDIYWPPIW